MNIKLTDKYYLSTDRYSMWIEEEFTGSTKNKEPKVSRRRISGYCSSYADLLENFTATRIRSIEKKDVVGILREIATSEKEAKKLAREIGKKVEKK